MPPANEQPINAADIADVGPIAAVPERVGICAEHGWWFQANPTERTCPDGDCESVVYFYRRES